MTKLWAWAAVGLTVMTAALASAAPVSYVRATSQRGGERGRFHPLNLLDDDAATMWCEGADGLGEGEGVQITFKRSQRIDRVVINASSDTGRQVLAVKLSDGTHTVSVPLGLEGGTAQALKKPLEGTTFDITISRVGAASEDSQLGGDVACLADTLLYLRDQLFGGGVTAAKLRYDARVDRLIGGWQGGELGAPEQSLVFALDGTWEWSYAPLLEGKPKKAAGEYRFRGDRLLMRKGEVGRWADMQFKVKHVAVDTRDIGAPKTDYDVISLGKALGPEFAGDYNNARFE